MSSVSSASGGGAADRFLFFFSFRRWPATFFTGLGARASVGSGGFAFTSNAIRAVEVDGPVAEVVLVTAADDAVDVTGPTAVAVVEAGTVDVTGGGALVTGGASAEMSFKPVASAWAL